MYPARRDSGLRPVTEPTVLFVAAVVLFFILLVWLHVLMFKEVRRRPEGRVRRTRLL